MAKKPTRAERFWQAERARKVARPTPAGTVFDVPEPFPAARLMQPGAECCVDPAIRKALDAGLLNGPFEAIREDLAIVCAMAWSAAGAVYAAQLAAPELRDRQAKAARLAEDLRRFLASVEDEAYDAEILEEKWEVDVGAADLRAMVEHGCALIALLEAYSKPVPVTQSAPATDHFARKFFAALDDWWRKHALNTERRGAKTIRNQIAVGLWQDLGRDVPDGYSDDDFARRGFRNLGR